MLTYSYNISQKKNNLFIIFNDVQSEGNVQESPMSQKVSMVTLTHDFEWGSSILKQESEKSPKVSPIHLL